MVTQQIFVENKICPVICFWRQLYGLTHMVLPTLGTKHKQPQLASADELQRNDQRETIKTPEELNVAYNGMALLWRTIH